MKKLLILILGLFLIDSAQSQTDTVQDLIDASSSIIDTVDLGHYAVQGLNYYAGVGGIAPTDTIDQALITQLQMTNYNNALSAVQNAVYYNTQALLQDAHETEMVQLESAVDDFVAATTSLITVVNVFEQASNADTVQEQQQLQDYIQDNNVGLTQTQVDNYNTSLESVQTHAINAAAFLAAANNEALTSSNDDVAEAYNVNLSNMTVAYNAVQDGITFYNNGQAFHSMYGFLSNSMKSLEDVYFTGESIYTGNSF